MTFGLPGLGFFADGLGRRRIGRGGFIFTLGIAQILSLESGIIAPIRGKCEAHLGGRGVAQGTAGDALKGRCCASSACMVPFPSKDFWGECKRRREFT